jgi:hypothetical protein
VSTFGTPAQLGNFLGVELSNDDERATLLLRIVSDTIRATLQQEIDQVIDDEVIIDPESDLRYAFLPQLPVTAVSRVEQGARNGDTWTLVDPADYTWYSDGTLVCDRYGMRWWGYWASRVHSLRVTYTHGYDPVPDALVAVTIAVAARLYENPLGTTQESLGAYSIAYGRMPGITFTDYEATALGMFDVARIQ